MNARCPEPRRGVRIPAQGNALGKWLCLFPRSEGTPHTLEFLRMSAQYLCGVLSERIPDVFLLPGVPPRPRVSPWAGMRCPVGAIMPEFCIIVFIHIT